MYCIIYERAPSQVTKNTNKFIKDYDAPQAFTKQAYIHLCMHIVERGVLYQVTFSIARNPVVILYSKNTILFVPKQRQIDS